MDCKGSCATLGKLSSSQTQMFRWKGLRNNFYDWEQVALGTWTLWPEMDSCASLLLFSVPAEKTDGASRISGPRFWPVSGFSSCHPELWFCKQRETDLHFKWSQPLWRPKSFYPTPAIFHLREKKSESDRKRGHWPDRSTTAIFSSELS